MSGLNSVTTLLTDATRRLAAALPLEPREARIEARVLLAHALNVDHAWLIAHDRDIPSADQLNCITTLIDRRLAGEPVAYILGSREFYGRTFKVTPDVLIPRPETELLVETAIALLPIEQSINTLDIGTGSGCIAITLALECPRWKLTAVDISSSALQIAKENARLLQVSVQFQHGDLFANLGTTLFDLVISNPPYIAEGDPHLNQGDVSFEPLSSLSAANEGLALLKQIIDSAKLHLQTSGWLLLEHGYDQGEICRKMMLAAGYSQVATHFDLAGHGRVTSGCADNHLPCDDSKP